MITARRPSSRQWCRDILETSFLPAQFQFGFLACSKTLAGLVLNLADRGSRANRNAFSGDVQLLSNLADRGSRANRNKYTWRINAWANLADRGSRANRNTAVAQATGIKNLADRGSRANRNLL